MLRDKLFTTFNTNQTDNTVTIGDNDYKQKQIITIEEINALLNCDLKLAGAGITDLTGIEYFAGNQANHGIVSLDLSNNQIKNNLEGVPDIEPLSSLKNMTSLTLKGQKYDFSLLNTYTQDANDVGTAGDGLTDLVTLKVVGCYNLDDDEVLAKLYQVYLANPQCTVYKDSEDAAWDPYLIPLAKYANSMPSAFNFVTAKTLDSTNYDTANMFLDETGMRWANVVLKNGKYFYKFRFYNTLNIYFELGKNATKDYDTYSGTKITGNSSTDKSIISTFATDKTNKMGTGLISNTGTGFIYNNLTSYSDSLFAKVYIYGDEKTGRSKYISTSHAVQFKLDFNSNLTIKFADMDSFRPLDEVFPGRDLRRSIMDTINSSAYSFSKNGSEYQLDLSSGVNDYFKCKSSKLKIDSTFYDNGENAIQGMQYTDITSLEIQRDASLGDGTYLTKLSDNAPKLETLAIGYSGIDLSQIDKTLDISKLIFGNTADNTPSNVKYDVYANLYNTEINNRESELNTLLTKLCAVSEGTDTYTSKDWNDLRAIVRSKDDSGNYYFYLNYFPNLSTFSVWNSNCSDWRSLLSLLFNSDTNNGSCDSNSLQKFINYSSTSNSNGPNKNSNYKISEPIIRQVYYHSTATGLKYQIGTKASCTASDLYDPATFHQYNAVYDTYLGNNTPSDPTDDKSYKDIYVVANENNEFGSSAVENGLFVDGINYYALTDWTVSQGQTIKLTLNSGEYNFGTNLTTSPFSTIRNNTVDWSLAGNPSGVTLSYNSDGTATFNFTEPEKDNFVVLKSTKSGVSTYYPLLFKGTQSYSDEATCGYSDGTYSYAAFKDRAFAYGIFLSFDEADRSTVITADNIANKKSLIYSSDEFTGGVSSIKGIELFKNLTELTISGQYFSDISAIEQLTQLTKLDVSQNLISSFDFTSLTKLTDLNISGNPLKAMGSLPVSLTKLNVSGAPLISGSDLNGKITGLVNLTELNLSSTGAVNDINTLSVLDTLLTSISTNSLNLALANSTPSAVTKAEVEDFISYLATGVTNTVTDTGFVALINSGGIDTNSFSLSNIQKSEVTFRNPYVYSNGFVIAGLKFSLINTTVNVVYTENTQLTSDITVRIHGDGSSNMPVRTSAASADIPATAFDSELYNYLISTGENQLDGNKDPFVLYNAAEFKIDSNIGMKSLKGLDRISTITSIEINGARFADESFGWTNDMPTVKYVRFNNCVLTENCLAGNLSHLTDITEFSADTSEGVDYSSLASEISSLAQLNYLQINNLYNYFTSYDADNIVKNDIAYTKAVSNILGTGSKSLSAYNSNTADTSKGGLNVTKAYMSFGDTTKTMYNRNLYTRGIFNYGWWAYPDDFCYSHYDFAEFNFAKAVSAGINKDYSSFKYLTRYISQISTNIVGKETLPKTLYYDDFAENEKGVSFYLPTQYVVYGQNVDISWSVTSSNNNFTGVTDTLTNSGDIKEFSINSTIEGVKTLEKGDKITLNITTTCNGKSVTDSFVMTIEKGASTEWDTNGTTDIDTLSDFYIEDEYGRIVNANTYFDSPRLIYYLFTDAKINLVSKQATLSSSHIDYAKYGAIKYLPQTAILDQESLIMSNQGVTSFNGLELFKNLKTISIDTGYPISLKPLSNMKLTSFTYKNDVTTGAMISDFSPLYNVTLRIENDSVADFRPLSELTKLSEVYLGGNLTAGGYYGTHGKINLCNYVDLCHRGVKVYVENNQQVVILDNDTAISPVLNADGFEITQSEEYLCVAINSIMNMNTYTTEDFANGDMVHDLKEYNSSTGVVNYATDIIDSESVANDHYVIHISDGTLDIYRYIRLNK